MSTGIEPRVFRRFSAPREDGAALVDPPFSAVGRLVAENLAHRNGYQYDFQGRSLADLTAHARAELLAEARRWTAAYRDVTLAAEDPGGLIFLAGHQPELFHPGVWFKNFALGELARRHGAAAVNLVIDSDRAKTTMLRVPGGTAESPRTQSIPFDQAGPPIPYEERSIVDRRVFADFGRRVSEWIKPLIQTPLIRSYWPLVCERARHATNLGACLAQSRHQIEGQWGSQTLEIPQSWVCGRESFAWLVAHLLAQRSRFRDAYNQAVHAYRVAHGIRNAAQPVPDLSQDGPWIESPFWIWTEQVPERRHLFARQAGSEVVLSDRQSLEFRLPLSPEGDAGPAVARLLEWGRRGIKIRSRALITTLWARLVLGDLFLHGIGGAKYDQVTDMLIESFFGLRAPGIMVLSATLLLPARGDRAIHRADGEIRRQLRELTYHPEKFIGDASRRDEAGADKMRDWLAAKQRWIHTPQTPENARQRWHAFREINAALQPYVAQGRRQWSEAQARAARALRAEGILAWREYGFCLYPAESLRNFLATLLPKDASLWLDKEIL